MLVFPHWKSEMPSGGCRAQRWLPAERFAPYFASHIALPPLPPQVEDEESSGGSSPERERERDNSSEREATVCAWRGCGARYASVARLSAHVARTHAVAHADGLFYCGWKGCTRPLRGFNARYKMLVHVRTHTNERPHTCNQCQKSFSRAENLKIHLRSHSGEKPYVCPYEGCGKAYSNSSDRFKHTRTHTVDKPYCCKVPGCNKRYTDPSSLRKHVKTYKHFTTEEAPRRDAYEDTRGSYSPHKDAQRFTSLEPMSPLQHRLTYTPPNSSVRSSPVTTYSSIAPLTEVSMSPVRYIHLDKNSFVRPFEHIYATRVPTQEMSHVEYSHMYEHAYRSYYANNISDPILRPTVMEKVFNYDETPRISDVTMDVDQITSFRGESLVSYSPVEEKPLNLICSKRLECKPIEELVRRTDLPLDLSTKT